jgi:nucleoside 2-deoxyribosyltransferase
MKTIYLAGFISTDYPQTYEWRKKAWQLLHGPYFEILSPLRGKENLGVQSNDGGLTSTVNTSRDIILRDFHDVKRSDVILANLENYGSPRPLLGTIYELGWAWEQQKPVVAVCSLENTLMRKHPFVVETVSHYFETVEEACKFTDDYYRQ